MKVLDIDIDFFLEDCCELAPVGERPPVSGCEPWSEERVRSFLEINLGLSKENRIKGRLFETHDEALSFWRELISEGKLSVPFEAVHIDAHSDLGIGRPGPGFVLNSVITLPVEKRSDIERYYRMRELDEANYLLFALAFRWVNNLINVRNPRSRPDIPNFAEKDEAGEYKSIRLTSFASKLLEQKNGAEPLIPFTVYNAPRAYRACCGFDFISVARSPRYLPKEADKLMDIAAEYVELI